MLLKKRAKNLAACFTGGQVTSLGKAPGFPSGSRASFFVLQPNPPDCVSISMKTNKLSASAALPLYTVKEEIWNATIHGVGVLAAIAGLVLLSLKAIGAFNGERAAAIVIVTALIFTGTMIGMFLISTLYHAIQHRGAKNILRCFDHSFIFVFIAGTYSPFCLAVIGGALGWSIFAVQWAVALLGVTLNFLKFKALKKVEIAAYIIMGWVIVICIVPLIRSVPAPSLILLLAGGIAYTLGTIWYRMKRVKHTHAVWHTFVMLGAVLHWFSLWYIL